MSASIHQIIVIFVAIAAGYTCRKLKLLTDGGIKEITVLVLNVCLPCMLFSSVVTTEIKMSTSGVLVYLAVITGMFLLSWLCGILLTRLTRIPKEDRGTYEFSVLAGNVSYVGLPICTAIFGAESTFYAALVNIPFNLLCFSVGIFMISGKVSIKRMINPAFIASVIAVVLYLLRVPVPAIITDSASFIGQATSVCAMIIIGSTLATVSIKELFTEWRLIPFALIRLFGVAALVMLILKGFGMDSVSKGVVILMAAMPTATNATMLATLYGGNNALSAKLIFTSTILSAVTLPVWGMILNA